MQNAIISWCYNILQLHILLSYTLHADKFRIILINPAFVGMYTYTFALCGVIFCSFLLNRKKGKLSFPIIYLYIFK